MQSKENNKQDASSPQYIVIPFSDISPQNHADDEIDLAEMWRAIWAGKVTIILITMLFSIASVIYAVNQPNIYKASALLAPASSEGGAGGLAALAGQFGGLASMAGINLSGGQADKTGLALEVLKSRVFIEKFIQKNELLVPLMAAENWNVESNKLIFDADIYDTENKRWVRDVKAPKMPQPSSWEAYDKFSKIFNVSKDIETGMVTLTLEHYSPYFAIQWLKMLVRDINSTIREQDKLEAQNSIDFLTHKLEQTQLSDMKTVFYQLIEEQTKTMMLAEVSEEYVLKTIDPANSPDEKVKPRRVLICILGTLLGGMLSVLIVLVRYFTNSKPTATPKAPIQQEQQMAGSL